MNEFLAQAITNSGGVSANWILVGVTSVAGFLFWNQLKDIKHAVTKAVDRLAEHDTEIQVLKTQRRNGLEDIEKLDRHATEQYEKIMAKLNLLNEK